MTALSSLLFPCFQAFFAVPSRPVPPSRPPFVTNLLRQPVSDLFQFYAAFSLPSRLISFSVTFSLPSRLIPFFAAFSPPSRLISFSDTFSLPSHLIPFFAAFSPLSRLILDFFLLLSVHLQYFQCIFPARSFCPYLPHTPRVFISSSNTSLSVGSEVICIHLLR